MENGFIDYKRHLPKLVDWINKRGGFIMFTIEEKYFQELNEMFPNMLLHEISRPFQVNQSVSSIT
jgi:hypothetical protein